MRSALKMRTRAENDAIWYGNMRAIAGAMDEKRQAPAPTVKIIVLADYRRKEED